MSDKNDNIIADKSMRDEYIKHNEVLDKVKELLLISGAEFLSTGEIAQYFEVGKQAIEAMQER